MFLRFVEQRNQGLIDYSAYLLENGLIEPDTYVLDLDSIESNADRLMNLSAASGIKLYFMAKQIGRNPEVSRRVLDHVKGDYGFRGMVAVDFREAETLSRAGLRVSHLGHLVQVPGHSIDGCLAMNPEIITVYSKEKAKAISDSAKQQQRVQKIMLKVFDKDDIFYASQESGFPLHGLVDAAREIMALPNIKIDGLTAFPCFLFNEELKRAVKTPNTETLKKADALLRRELGIHCSQINMPSCNSHETISLIRQLGGTHAEPGHSVTGTSPDNPGSENPLIPSMVYVSEISHHFGGDSFCYGGGYYRRSHLKEALVKTGPGFGRTLVDEPDPESIDYHFRMKGMYPVGAPVIMSFRTQIFVTRSRVALAENLSKGSPRMVGIWDAQGNRVSPGRAI